MIELSAIGWQGEPANVGIRTRHFDIAVMTSQVRESTIPGSAELPKGKVF
jgi:hypothetical protein